MPDPTRPSREAREAAARLWLRLPDYHRLDRRAEVDIARALDDFAEKVTQERDALRRQIARLLKALRIADDHPTPALEAEKTVSYLNDRVRALTVTNEHLRRRVAELEGEVETERLLVRAAQEAAQEQKARAEAAEGLRELLIARGGWKRDDGRTFLTLRVADGADLSCRATREDAINAAVEEARRARGEGKA